MKILILMRYANPPAGGAEKSLIELAKRLSKEFSVKIISLGYKNEVINLGRVRLEEVEFRKNIRQKSITLREIEKKIFLKKNLYDLIKKKVLEYSPDIIITQHEASFLIKDLRLEANQKFKWIHMINGREYTLKQESNNWIDLILRKTLGLYLDYKTKELISLVDKIIFPSDYLMKDYPDKYNKKYAVIAPFMDLKYFFKIKNNGKSILHIKATKSKGFDITMELAKNFPKKNFIVCGKIDQEYKEVIKGLKNISYIGYTKNMLDVYKKSSILIVPTFNGETFSMSSIEAQAAGLNIIVNKGGIIAPKESFVRSSDIKDWIKALKMGGSKMKRTELKRYDARIQYNKFKEIIKNLK